MPIVNHFSFSFFSHGYQKKVVNHSSIVEVEMAAWGNLDWNCMVEYISLTLFSKINTFGHSLMKSHTTFGHSLMKSHTTFGH